jgi:hypothetical protein
VTFPGIAVWYTTPSLMNALATLIASLTKLPGLSRRSRTRLVASLVRRGDRLREVVGRAWLNSSIRMRAVFARTIAS